MSNSKTILGLDLGTNSLGWAIVQPGNKRKRLIDIGVRVFEAGLDKLEQKGKGESRNLERRSARLARRQTDRRSRRKSKLLGQLQKIGLLPGGKIECSQDRHEYINTLDSTLGSPYELRSRALSEKLKPEEIGRALYHLGQRRGFLSNRKSPPKDKKEDGIVQGAIKELAEEISRSGSRSLGQHFSVLVQKGDRVRGRYTGREFYQKEFELIWEKQQSYHPDLMTEDCKRRIHRTIFHQRPLKSQKNLVGRCQLERDQRRAPWALLESQRFRYLQKLVDLKVIDKVTGEERALTDGEFAIATELCEKTVILKLSGLRKALSLSARSTTFNLEAGGEKSIPGNSTAARLRKALGDQIWCELGPQSQNALIVELRNIDDDNALRSRLKKLWGFDDETLNRLAQVQLESSYCRFSLKAIRKLLPELELRTSLNTIIREIYPERWERNESPCSTLPAISTNVYRIPVSDSRRWRAKVFVGADEVLGELRNPIVERSLAELRSVVNAIIGRYGKPDEIHIELGRDLRQASKQREDTWKKNRANEKARKDAAERILKETQNENPSRDDILKVLLADECEWTCPYTGKKIKMSDLFGTQPRFDIEHIIPFKRCLDDSYMNKTLCLAEENRNVKRDRTPYEAYQSSQKWDDMLQRVKAFKGSAGRAKLRRFEMHGEELDELLSGFTSQQLNDTRWASIWGKRYLGLLYGGVDSAGIDGQGKRRVQASSGRITGHLRWLWGLNSVLGDGDFKSRDDHRHHAVDAVVIALTNASTVKRLSDAAKRADSSGQKRLYSDIEPPWEGFRDEIKSRIESIVTSHRVQKRVRGALHKDTFYGLPRKRDTGKTYVHMRVSLSSLTAKDIDKIVDQTVREKVRNHLEKHNGDLKRAFGHEENLPDAISGGKKIRRVRIERTLETYFTVGEADRERRVRTDSNHHIEIVAILNEKGEPMKWEGHVVSLFEAYRRRLREEPIVKRDWGENKRFVFSLANSETIELDCSEGGRARGLFILHTIGTSTIIRFTGVNDARTLTVIGRKGLTTFPEPLRIKLRCQKVFVTPLGEVRRAND
ncbi:MAG: type II CRISPR RNA-guided endonuclease Cas9 [candidate division Zixibacteria bacterium]|nr:type II CRISPR RNA-guided endonuclease Cas9 [candidate division Zixibacteria bacterium]